MGLPELNRASLHHAILRHFVEHGFAPSHAQLQDHFHVDTEAMTQALRDLADDHGVVLHPHAPEVWVAHPFCTAPTTFVVRQGARMWWGNCAWCSLGIAALLGGSGVSISTSLGAEGGPVTIHVDHHRVREDLVVHFPVAMIRAWDNVIYTCSTMLLFEREADVDEWSRRHAIARGDVQSVQRVYDFARVWYGRHLDEDWRKWTMDEAQSIFAQFGFRGRIWELPLSAERF
jgi:hypothetical protein